jgi:hypothetical protein
VLARNGRVATLVGADVVYLMGRAATAATMTPYDVAAVRLADGLVLAGEPPEDADRYVDALRSDRAHRAAADAIDGLVTAPDLAELVERVTRLSWSEAELQARAAGALVGATATEEG